MQFQWVRDTTQPHYRHFVYRVGKVDIGAVFKSMKNTRKMPDRYSAYMLVNIKNETGLIGHFNGEHAAQDAVQAEAFKFLEDLLS